MPILQDVRLNLHSFQGEVQLLGLDAFQHIAAQHMCQNLDSLDIDVLGDHLGTQEQPVVFQLPGLRTLRLITNNTLHVSLQGSLPTVLCLCTVAKCRNGTGVGCGSWPLFAAHWRRGSPGQQSAKHAYML